jgi:hypothetical protein
MPRTRRYNGFYKQDHSKIIFRNYTDPATILKMLQFGTEPAENDPHSTYWRTDRGDPFEFAAFVTPDGQTIMIVRMN